MVSYTIIGALIALAVAAPVAEPQLEQITGLLGKFAAILRCLSC